MRHAFKRPPYHNAKKRNKLYARDTNGGSDVGNVTPVREVTLSTPHYKRDRTYTEPTSLRILRAWDYGQHELWDGVKYVKLVFGSSGREMGAIWNPPLIVTKMLSKRAHLNTTQ